MARGTIVTRTLGDVTPQADGTFKVTLSRNRWRVLETQKAAQAYLEKYGQKRYDTVIRVNGKQRWKTFTKKKEAEDYLDRHSSDIRDGTYRELKKATFEVYAEHWKATNLIPQKLKPSTINGYGSILDTHLVPEFGPYPLQAIDAAQITNFEARLLQRKDFSPKSVRNVLTLLTRIFKNARQERYVRISPMADVEKTKVPKVKKGRALNAKEVEALLSKCENNLRLIILIALLSGVRRSELFGLKWPDLDFEKNVIRIRRGVFFKYGKHQNRKKGEDAFVFVAPKSEASVRDIPLSPALKRELQARYLKSEDKAGLLFHTTAGGPVDPNNICRWLRKKEDEAQEPDEDEQQPTRLYMTFNAAVKAAKIGKVRFHDLRHTYGSVLREQRVDYYDIKRWMGHSSIQVTIDVYGQPLNDHGQEAAAKADAFLLGSKVAAD